MTAPNGDEMWADLEAAPLNIWYGDPQMGLWCPVCKLPSGWKLTFTIDPNGSDEGIGLYGCVDADGHGSAVRDEAIA